jgi:hypothetical protein
MLDEVLSFVEQYVVRRAMRLVPKLWLQAHTRFYPRASSEACGRGPPLVEYYDGKVQLLVQVILLFWIVLGIEGIPAPPLLVI